MNAVLALAVLMAMAGCGNDGGGGERAASSPPPGEAWQEERLSMVKTQLESRDIKSEPVREVMRRVPRHEFVPLAERASAYEDRPLPIGHGQTISQPYIVALMTQALELKPGERVLEIGSGSGYQAAVLAGLEAEVYTIEIVPALAEYARSNLVRLNYRNVTVRCGDGYEGWKEHAPFDAIIVTCAPDHVPQPLVDQLKEGGRMCIPVGTEYGVQELVLLAKKGGKIERQHLIPVRFVPMTGKASQ